MAKCLALVGPTSIGKTKHSLELAKIYCKGDPNGCLFVRDINDLKAVTESTKVLIFDDISFEFRRPEELIHLTDPYYPATVRVLRSTVHVRADIEKIFTHNSDFAFKPALCQKDQDLAIQRRLQVVQVQTERNVRDSLIQFLEL